MLLGTGQGVAVRVSYQTLCYCDRGVDLRNWGGQATGLMRQSEHWEYDRFGEGRRTDVR